MHVLDEAADLQWPRVVAQCHAVGGKAGQLVEGGCEREQVVFDGEVEGVGGFELVGERGGQ